MQGGTGHLYPSRRNQWLTAPTRPCFLYAYNMYMSSYGVFMLFCFHDILHDICFMSLFLSRLALKKHYLNTRFRKRCPGVTHAEVSLQLLNFVIYPYLNELLHFYIF